MPSDDRNTLVAEPVDSDALRHLQVLFNMPDPPGVIDFVRRRPALLALLEESHTYLRQHFPLAPLRLQVHHDPEAVGVSELVVSIVTRLSADEALDLLDQFDQAWWLTNAPRAHGELVITLSYL